MHIPMSRHEIANYLAIQEVSVEELWRCGSLKRSLSNDLRSNSSLAQSSIFDVLEVALISGAIGVEICRSEAEAWIDLLCRACDWNDWDEWTPLQKVDYLMENASDVMEIKSAACKSLSIARVLSVAHCQLLSLCIANDRIETART